MAEDSHSSLSTLLASEKERRLRAERQVEELRQSCLEFSRLLELEKKKAKRYTLNRGPVNLSVSCGVGRGSVSQEESVGESREGSEEEGRSSAEPKRKVRGKEERERKKWGRTVLCPPLWFKVEIRSKAVSLALIVPLSQPLQLHCAAYYSRTHTHIECKYRPMYTGSI